MSELTTTVFPVSVTVTVDATTGTPTITCAPDPVPITSANALINYTLTAPSNYEFASTSAIVVATSPEFPYASWTTSSVSAQLFDTCTDNLTYKYTVNLVDTNTGDTVSVDPAIKNNGTHLP